MVKPADLGHILLQYVLNEAPPYSPASISIFVFIPNRF